MLDAFLRRQEIDILLVQEVTYHVLNDFQGYTTQYNIGANRWGTAIVARDEIHLENVTMIPTGRAMAAKFREVWVINVYAPSGRAMKQEREYFFSSELPYLLTAFWAIYYWVRISTAYWRLRTLPAASNTAEH